MGFFADMFQANISSSFLPGEFLLANLPDASSNTRKYAWCSDLHDNQPDYVLSDGTNWKPVRPNAVRDIATASGAMTLQTLKNSPTQRIKNLTGNATVTLSTTLVYSGAKFRVKKEASGLLTATLVGLVNTILPGLTPSWADYEYSVGDGGWFISASGGLL